MKSNKGLFCLSLLVFLGLAQLAALAQWQPQSQSQRQQSIRARISGGGGSGKCTFEVTLDGAADVEIQGDQGWLRWVGGGGMSWRRLDCNQPLPRNPGNFQFRGIDGRGTQTLVRTPASNNGIAVIRLDDPQKGSETYTGDITWNGGDNDAGGWNGGGNRDDRDRGDWNRGGNSATYHGRLRIIQAQYGVGNRFADVTSRLNSEIQNGQLNLQVNNNTMGGDPARSKDKTLRVQYMYNGQRGQMVINEGDYLRLPRQ